VVNRLLKGVFQFNGDISTSLQHMLKILSMTLIKFLPLLMQEKEMHVFSRMFSVLHNVMNRAACLIHIQKNILCPKIISCNIDALLSYLKKMALFFFSKV